LFRSLKIPKLIKRIITLVVAVAFVFLLITGIIAYFIKSKEPPSIQDAPWAIQTSSRMFYASNFTVQQGVQEIKGYWYSDGGRWIYESGIKPFPADLYPHIDVIRRTK
jgi:hypothetical protein